VVATTQVDEAICEKSAEYGFPTSARSVRTLREYGVIETVGSKKGGRSQVARYRKGSAEIVAMVEQAKLEPQYARKLHRAVLIAWVRGARIGSDGLRWAYREHFKAELQTAENLLAGKRVEDKETDIRFPPEVHRVIARAQLGKKIRPDDLASLERHTGPLVREVMSRSQEPDLLPPAPGGSNLGLAIRRSDGSWRIEEFGTKAWEAMALRPQAEMARTARREELDAARGPTRAVMGLSGFNASDIVVAGSVPESIFKFRKWGDAFWWNKPYVPLGPEGPPE
jgi:hypothetical protein